MSDWTWLGDVFAIGAGYLLVAITVGLWVAKTVDRHDSSQSASSDNERGAE